MRTNELPSWVTTMFIGWTSWDSISADAFGTMVDDLNAKIPSPTRAEVIVEMAKIGAAVGDSHTNIYPIRNAAIGFHALPVTFTFFGDKLYMRAVQEPQRPPPGRDGAAHRKSRC